MPRTGGAYGDSTQISRPEDSRPSPTLLASTSENTEEGTAQTEQTTAQTTVVSTGQAVPTVIVVAEQPEQSAGLGATQVDVTHRAYRNTRVSMTILRRH